MKRIIQYITLLAASFMASMAFAAEPPNLDAVLSKNFEVTLMDGSRVPLSKILVPGKLTVVEFWATWCPPCRKTIPSIIELNHRYRDQDLQVIGLTIEDPSKDLQKVGSFVKELGADYVNAFASHETFRLVTGRTEISVPKILVYDKDGKVIKFITSYSFLTHRHIESAIKAALKSTSH